MRDDVVQSNKYKLFTVGAIGTFMATLDGSILNVALPTISRDLNCPVDVVVWVVLAYSLTLIALMLVFGNWVDKKGYAFGYKFGYAFFVTGSAVCALSGSIYLLVFGRVIQAVGSAMFASIGPGMVTYIFPAEERGKGIGMMTMMVSAGFMVGPVAGGLLLDLWPWQSIFVVNIPIGLFGLVMAWRYFKTLPHKASDRKLKLKGAISISLALVTGAFALSLISDYPLSDVRVWAVGLVSLAALAAFYKFESRAESAMIGFEIFKNRQFTTSVAAMLLIFMAFSGVMILVPFYLEQIKHFEPKQVGLYLIILPVLMFVLSPSSGRLSDKIGFRFLTSLGVIILAGGLSLLSGVDTGTTNSYIALSLVLVGAGSAIFNTPNASALMGSVHESQRAVASGILATTRNIGISVGVATSTALLAYFQLDYKHLADQNLIFIESYHKVIGISIFMALISLPFCLGRKNRLD